MRLYLVSPSSHLVKAHELDQKIQDVYRRIQTERKMLEATQRVRQATTNPDVLRSTDAKMREAERSLSYFEDLLRQLQSRKMAQAQQDDQSRSGSPGPGGTGYGQRGGRSSGGTSQAQAPLPDSSRRGAHSPQSPESRATGLGDDTSGPPKPKTYTKLDLIKADTPHTTAKISRMLHELEFKLQVEIQLKKGIDKMAKLFQADGDRRSKQDAEAKKIESERKIALLQTALKRYKTLHILDDAEEEDDIGELPVLISQSHPFNAVEVATGSGPGGDDERKDLRSKNLSGKLYITLKGARELEHAPRYRSAKQSETFVSFKVEGQETARSHPTKTDRWMEEFEIVIDKANEVEITVYEKSTNDQYPIPTGLLWIKISDLVDAQRKQKVMLESGQGGWVTAGAMNGDGAHGAPAPGYPGGMDAPVGYDGHVVPPSSSMPSMGGQPEGIDAWFAVEPAGALALHLNFGEHSSYVSVL